MKRDIPEKLLYFIKNATKDVEDGYEYASELNRVLNSDECQLSLTEKEIDALKNYAYDVRNVGELNYYTEQKIKEIEQEHFGSQGISGFLGITKNSAPKWPF